jgi:hypothetical protein
MADISTRDAATTKIKLKNTRTEAVVEAILERVSGDRKTLTVIVANTRIVMQRGYLPNVWVGNAHGMELTALHKL